MKAKKHMELQKLTTAVVDAVKAHFQPDVPLIKQRIEYLIEQVSAYYKFQERWDNQIWTQEYVMRDEGQKNLLHYVA